MHQASLIAPNIIVTTGCSSSHLPLAGPSSTFCLTHAPLHSCTLTHNRHAHFLILPNTHSSWPALALRLLFTGPHFSPSKLMLLCESTSKTHSILQQTSAWSALKSQDKPNPSIFFHVVYNDSWKFLSKYLIPWHIQAQGAENTEGTTGVFASPAVAVEKGHTTLLSHHAVAPVGLNFCPALHIHSHVCLGTCLHGKIIARKAGMWINSTSLQGTLQVQWGLVCTRTLLWRQPRCKSPTSWHQLPQTQDRKSVV